VSVITALAEPVLHRFDDGGDEYVPTCDVPHDPLTAAAARVAVHDAFEPPPDPLHDHVYVPGFVVTAVAVPAPHKFVDGGVALGNVPPFDVPHDPLTGPPHKIYPDRTAELVLTC
jgi:hypothetical protein